MTKKSKNNHVNVSIVLLVATVENGKAKLRMIVAEAMSMIVVVDLSSLGIFSIDIQKNFSFLIHSSIYIDFFFFCLNTIVGFNYLNW